MTRANEQEVVRIMLQFALGEKVTTISSLFAISTSNLCFRYHVTAKYSAALAGDNNVADFDDIVVAVLGDFVASMDRP